MRETVSSLIGMSLCALSLVSFGANGASWLAIAILFIGIAVLIFEKEDS